MITLNYLLHYTYICYINYPKISHLKISLCIYFLYYAVHVQKISRHLSYFIKGIMLLLCESVYYNILHNVDMGQTFFTPNLRLYALPPERHHFLKISALERNHFFIEIKTNS